MKLPVHLGDLRGPAGNVFAVVGQLKRTIRQLEQAGITIPEQARKVADEFATRTYEETLDLIGEHYEDLDGSLEELRHEGM